MKIARKEEIATTVLDQECIILDLKRGQYFGLENALKELWLEIEHEYKDTKIILTKWKKHFNQTEEELAQILYEAIRELADKQLIKIRDI
ncbi:hypothetical protein [Lysinibacillus sp. FSL W8-0992]|uniref:hypothetical protein n=1 Tax=Lysinibacillus sp. FSL W8-0992 TaxID=2954643 RepID=UPI0030F95568